MAFDINTKNLVKPANDFGDNLPDGLYAVVVNTVEYTTSSTGNPMLKLSYKTDKGRLIFDQIMDDPTKQLNTYRLGRLLHALNLTVNQAVELKDMTKIIKPGSKLVVAIFTKEGSRFTNIDINSHEGYYQVGELDSAPKVIAEQQAQTQVADSPELDINSDDSTF